MIAASVLKLNPKELAKELKDNLDDLDIFKDVQIAGPGFVNITLHKKEFVSVLNTKLLKKIKVLGNQILELVEKFRLNLYLLIPQALFMLAMEEVQHMVMRLEEF